MMFLKNSYQGLVIKAAISLFYLILLLGILYLPLVWDYFLPRGSLNICTLTESFHPETIRAFEEKYNIKINMTYIDSDDETFAKFQLNGGRGYDLILAADYMVNILAKAGYLYEFDHKQLNLLQTLDSRLLDLEYDPTNKYSVPYKWYLYGVLYNKNIIPVKPEDFSLKYIFTSPKILAEKKQIRTPFNVCMLDSANDMFFFGLLAHQFDVKNFSEIEALVIKKMLIEQKKWVECYTFNSSEIFLLTEAAHAAITANNFARRVMHESSDFDFAIPKEGGILVIENLCIPALSNNKDMAQKFIRFMLQDSNARLAAEEYGWSSSNFRSNQQGPQGSHVMPDENIFKRLHIPLFTDEQRKLAEKVWLEVGFS